MTSETKIVKNTTGKAPWAVLVIGVVAVALAVGGWYYYDQWRQRVLEDEMYSGGDYYEESAQEYTSETTFYNDYFGFSYTAPQGWVQYDLWGSNLSLEKETITSLQQMEIENFGSDMNIQFISVANEKFSENDSHYGLDLSTENAYQASNLEEYVDLYDSFMLAEDEVSGKFTLKEAEQIELAGRVWEKRVYHVVRDSDRFYAITLITAMRDNFYLIAESSYWETNQGAKDEFIQHVSERVKFFE